MKMRALVMASVMALTGIASTRVAQAQEPLVIRIPFDFVVGGKTLPAGEYSVNTSGPERTLLLIDRQDPSASIFMGSNAIVASEPKSESKLVFNRYGDRYFLSQVWTAGNSCGRLLLMSDREKEVAQTAKFETQGQVTLVAGLTHNTR
jgi:hypothetical protein